MTESELRRILDWLDSALDVYRAHEGKLAVSEIKAGSMLLVVREAVADELRRINVPVQRAGFIRKP